MSRVESLSLWSCSHSQVALCLEMPHLTPIEQLLIRCSAKGALKMFMLLRTAD